MRIAHPRALFIQRRLSHKNEDAFNVIENTLDARRNLGDISLEIERFALHRVDFEPRKTVPSLSKVVLLMSFQASKQTLFASTGLANVDRPEAVLKDVNAGLFAEINDGRFDLGGKPAQQVALIA